MLAAVTFGFGFGFVGSMPLAGPIAILVFVRAVDGRPRTALYIGLGCAVAEAAYATLAFLGFSALLRDVPFIVPASRALAAVILLGLAFHFLRRPDDARPEPGPEGARSGSFLLGFTITALNPTLIGTWAAATATLFSTGMVPFEPALAVPFGLAVAGGIAGWYLVLTALVRRYRERFRIRTLNRVIRVTGALLVFLAIGFAYHFSRALFALSS